MSLFRTLKNCLMSAFRISYFPHNYPLAITCPYRTITCPYCRIRMGYCRCKKDCCFYTKKVAEIFGSFEYFS
jgi:hypothetical protein